MKYAEALELISKTEGMTDALEAVRAEMATVNSEAAKRRTEAKTATEKLTKFESISKTLTDNEIDLEGDLAAQIVDLKASKGKASEADATAKRLARIEKDFADMTKERDEAVKRAHAKAIDATFSRPLDETFHGGQFMLDSLASKGLIGLDGETPFVTVDGEKFDMKTGIEALKKTYASAVKNTQSPGSGQPGQSAGGAKGGKQVSRAEFDAMEFAGRSAFIKDGGSIVSD